MNELTIWNFDLGRWDAATNLDTMNADELRAYLPHDSWVRGFYDIAVSIDVTPVRALKMATTAYMLAGAE